MKTDIKILSGFICIFVLLLFATSLRAQDQKVIEKLRVPPEEVIQIIKTYQGSTLIGRISRIDEENVVFVTEHGELIVPASSIEEIKETQAHNIRDGKYWPPNPNATRLLFAPTGRMLKENAWYFADYYIFFPGIAYGLSDNVTIGGGISLFPGARFDKQLLYFTPKVGLKNDENMYLAAGALIIKIPDSDNDDNPTVGIAYGVGTWGTPEASITGGFGFGFVDGDFADKPMVMIGGEKRLSRRTAFVTENWILPGLDDPIISYGIRFLSDRMTFDLALWLPLSADEHLFPGIPYIDFVFYSK